MPHCEWDDLPAGVRRQVEPRAGAIRSARTVANRSAAELAVVLDTVSGPFFCKGGVVDMPAIRPLRTEARVNRWLPDVVPRLLWTVEAAGWLLLGFAYADGRHPDFAPGSADLGLVADLLTHLAADLTPCPPVPVQPFTERWRGLIAPELVDGDTLLHTDPTPRNFLLADRLRLVDWSAPCRGAAWIDPAFTVVRLIRAGRHPADAEAWAGRIPAWRDASVAAVDAFSEALVRLWSAKQRSSPAPHRSELLRSAELWRDHRLHDDVLPNRRANPE